MTNLLSIDVEEWFQVENLKVAISRGSWDKCESRIVRSTRKILKILKDNNTNATFFVLGWVASKFPNLIREIDRNGHEIACHGFNHKLIYNETREEFKNDILKAKDILESIIGKDVIGYRAPGFSITKNSLWTTEVLKDCGFQYDSSIFPVSFHDRYGFSKISDSYFCFRNGLIEIPITTLDILGIRTPLGGGGYFRLLPYRYFQYSIKHLNRNKKRVVFYLHPWELDANQPRIKLPLKYSMYSMRHYINLNATENKFKSLLEDFGFQPIRNILGECKIWEEEKKFQS